MTEPKNRHHDRDYSCFTELYHELKFRLTERNALYSSIVVIFAPNYVLVNLAVVFALTYLTILDPIGAIGFGLYVLFLIIFAVLMLATFVSLALIGSRSSEQHVNNLISRLLLTVKTPYQNRYGLNIHELAVIKALAQSEQAAADWRGTYANIMVIGAIGFLWGAGSPAAQWFSEKLPANFQVQSLISIRPMSIVILIVLSWGVACLIANMFGAKLLNYLHDFLISEFSNRAIIYACIDAEALLLSQNVKPTQIPGIVQRKSIATLIGYTVISQHDVEWNYLSSSAEMFTHRGRQYALINEAEKEKIIKRMSS